MVQDARKNFEASGKISDYLTYRQNAKAEGGGKGAAKSADEAPGNRKRGWDGYGTEHCSDGNGIAGHADGRIR